MNLAEIRKKARKEKVKSEIPDTRSEPEVVADAGVSIDDVPVPAEPTLENEPSEVFSVPELTDETGGEVATSHHFDPLAVLLAGRERAFLEEEKINFSSVQMEYAGTSLQEFLCFRVANETYAVSIMDIKEIIKPRLVTEVPRVPGFVSGVLSLRGIIIPVFQMRHRLGLPSVGTSGKERIIVVKQGEGFCGLLVDEVTQVVKIAAEGIEDPPTVLDGIDRDFVRGIGRHTGQMLILLNLEKILDVSLC